MGYLLLCIETHTDCTGTFPACRAGSAKDVLATKLRTGIHKAKFFNSVVFGKWRDKRDVSYISSEYKGELVTLENTREQLKEKPLRVMYHTRNIYMIDMYLQDYSVLSSE